MEDKADFDADMAYERYREDAGDGLFTDLNDLFKKWVENKPGYYNGDATKFVEHCISSLETVAGVRVKEVNGFLTAKQISKKIWCDRCEAFFDEKHSCF